MVITLPPGCFGVALGPRGAAVRVFAPSATGAAIVIYDEARGSAGRREFPLSPNGDGTWQAFLTGEWEGRFYVFRFEGPAHDGAEVIDLWAVNTVDSTRRARLTDLRRTDPPGWERGRVGPTLTSPVDAVICELHVRDLTSSAFSGVRRRGGYLGWCESGTTLTDHPDVPTAVDHLVELGITHVQLMPIQDFDADDVHGPYFWGYMTAAYFSPEGSFASETLGDARCRELKHLIQAVHNRGLGVVLDVVYNHVGKASFFETHAPGYYFRRWPDGSVSNGSGCGNDFRTESEQGRRFIIENLKFWVREYGIDGFRFDLMELIDRETMVEAERELRSLRPDILLYGEPWSAGPSPVADIGTGKTAIAGTQIGAFNDDFRNAVKGPPDDSDPGFIQRGWNRDAVRHGLIGEPSWAPSPAHAIQYLACHDNLCLYDKLVASLPSADDARRRRVAALGYFVLLTAQGVPLLHGGDEFFRTKYGDANSYRSSDAINAIDWRRKAIHRELFETVKSLVALRRAHPLFRLRTREEVAARCRFHDHAWWDTIMLEIDGRGLPGEPWARALVLINGSPDAECAFAVPEGKWRHAFGEADKHLGVCRVPSQSAAIFAIEA